MLAMDQLRRADVTRAYQDQQYVIRRQALSELLTLWPIWDLSRLDETWEPFETALLSVIERYHQLSTTHAGRYYSTLRLVQGIPGETEVLRAEFDRQRWQSNLRLLGPIFTKKQILNRRPNPKDVALVRLSGVVTAGVLDGGRDTLLRTGAADRRSAGWRRVTEGTCAWCRQLAAWGAFHRNGPGWQGHTNCRCVVEPQWEDQIDTPPIDMAGFKPSGLPDGTHFQDLGGFSDADATHLGYQSRQLSQAAEKAHEQIMQAKQYYSYTRSVGGDVYSSSRIGTRLNGRVSAEKIQAALDRFTSTDLHVPDYIKVHLPTPGEVFAQGMRTKWAGTSGDTDPVALVVQRAAAQRHGVAWPPVGYDIGPATLEQVEDLYREHGEVLDAFLDETYAETQRLLDEMFPDQDTITLFRGISDPLVQTTSGPVLYQGGLTGLAPGAGTSTGSVTLNPLSSFSLSPSTGQSFGNVTMRVEVPKSRIMGNQLSGMGTDFESEFVVIGGATEDTVTWAMKGSS